MRPAVPQSQKRAKLPPNQPQTSKRSFKHVGDNFTEILVYFESIFMKEWKLFETIDV